MKKGDKGQDKTYREVLDATKKLNREEEKPVSYTHLDVYKRQHRESFSQYGLISECIRLYSYAFSVSTIYPHRSRHALFDRMKS